MKSCHESLHQLLRTHREQVVGRTANHRKTIRSFGARLSHQLQSLAEGEFMANLKGLASIVSELGVERTNLANQLKRVDAALSVLGKLGGGSSNANPSHTMSAAGRRRISLAQKARWAKRA